MTMPASHEEHAVLVSAEDKNYLLNWLTGTEKGSWAAESGLLMVTKHDDGSLTVYTQCEPFVDPDTIEDSWSPEGIEVKTWTRTERLIEKHRRKARNP